VSAHPGLAALVALGLAACGWGVRAATSPRRPLDLVGALVAAAGAAFAALAGAALVVPGFFG
jgi:hypothetical protein